MRKLGVTVIWTTLKSRSVLTAICAAPRCNFGSTPGVVLVPSGNISNTLPLLNRSSQSANKSSGASLGIYPAAFTMCFIKGFDHIADFTKYTADIDDEYELTLEQNGTQAKLVAQNKSNTGITFYSGQSPSIDLVVTVPNKLNLDINDGSGDIVINAMQSNIDVKDGSGSIDINSAKNLNIDDGSGSIYVKNVVGDLALNDGSGSIDIDNVSGNVAIEDGSGEMQVTNVTGALNVEDGSGGITIKHINGAVTVDDNSGDMLVEHIDSSVTIEDGSGDIRVNHAKGLTITEAGSGDVSIDNISGSVKLD